MAAPGVELTPLDVGRRVGTLVNRMLILGSVTRSVKTSQMSTG